jgi:hypothetical protein
MPKHPADNNAPIQPGRKDEKLGMVASLEEMRKEGYVPFTYGPLYVYGNVPFDIVARFGAETMEEVDLTFFDFQGFSIITLPDPYDHRLFAMRDESYSKFSDWLKTVEIADREAKKYCVPRCIGSAIMDPFMREMAITVPRPEVIDVWTVSAMAGIAVPETHIEQLPYPIFKPGEAEELKRTARDEYLARMPKPLTAPNQIVLQRKPADPAVITRGKLVLGEL